MEVTLLVKRLNNLLYHSTQIQIQTLSETLFQIEKVKKVKNLNQPCGSEFGVRVLRYILNKAKYFDPETSFYPILFPN